MSPNWTWIYDTLFLGDLPSPKWAIFMAQKYYVDKSLEHMFQLPEHIEVRLGAERILNWYLRPNPQELRSDDGDGAIYE